jgi:hypothetical protein
MNYQTAILLFVLIAVIIGLGITVRDFVKERVR